MRSSSASALTGGERRPPSKVGKADVAFFAFLGLFTAVALLALLAGVLSAVASSSDAFHDRLHEWGLEPTPFGESALAMADAAHRAQPPEGLAIDYAFSLLNLALAGFLIWLRPRDRTARLLAIGMVGIAAVFNLQAHGVYEAGSGDQLEKISHDALHLVAAVAYIFALLSFPDGRLVPRWSRAAKVALYAPATVAVAVAAFQLQGTTRTVALILYFGLLTPIAGVASQAYRYRRSPTPVERQQSRLLFWALVPAVLVGLIVLTSGVRETAFETFEGRFLPVIPVELFRVFQPVFALIPLALFVGILRYRLWGIDRVISRALLYGILAGFVTAVYVGVVVGVGRVVGDQGADRGNLGLSILATGIVALAFEPVKERVNRLVNRLVYGKRATPYEVLSEFCEKVADTVATEDLLSRLARILAEGTGAQKADVWLVIGDEARPAASWPVTDGSAPAALPVVNGQLPPMGGVSAVVPVRHHGELLGALAVTKPGRESLSPTEEKLVSDVGAQAGLVLRNGRLTAELMARLEELKASRLRLVAAQDEERRRMERDLHDGAQQQLVALKIQLSLVEQLAEGGQPVAPMLAQLKQDTTDALETLRDLARGIYPPLLASEGLPTALAGHARRVSVPVEIVADGVGRYPKDLEAAVYFCCLEALQNVAKYARASSVTVNLRAEGGSLTFTVSDDGTGFDPASTPQGSGSQNMADRMEALDGTLEILSRPGGGTTVRGSVPCSVDDGRPLVDLAH